MSHDSFYDIQTKSGWSRTLESFARWCRPFPGCTVLDVGCGAGLLPMLLERYGCTAVGIDLDLNAFYQGKLHPNLAAADALQLPFGWAVFDLVTASNLLFLLPDPLATLVEMRRVLKPTGQVVVLNPSENLNISEAQLLADSNHLEGINRRSLLNWASLAEANRRWGEEDLKKLLNEAGLSLIETVLKVGNGLARFARAGIP